MTMLFSEAKFWSMMTVDPVKTEHDMFYWQGWLMAKEMVFNIMGVFFMDSAVTPSMKNKLYELTLDRMTKYELKDFDIGSMYSTLLWDRCRGKGRNIIYKPENEDVFKKYRDDPFLVLNLIYGDE